MPHKGKVGIGFRSAPRLTGISTRNYEADWRTVPITDEHQFRGLCTRLTGTHDLICFCICFTHMVDSFVIVGSVLGTSY